MNYFLVTFDEIFLKSERVSRKLIKTLEKQLKEKGIKEIVKKRFKFLIPYKDEEKLRYKKILTKTFGIKKIYEVKKFKSYEELLKFLNNYSFNEKSFKFIVKRVNKNFPKTSLEVAKELGGLFSKKDKKVNLKNPEKIFYLEIDDCFYFSDTFYYGLGGLPLGTQGKTLALFSGGIDSPVSSFLIAKRGIKPFLFFVYNGNPIVLFKTFLVYKKINEYLNTEFYYFSLNVEILKEINKVRRGYKQIVFKYFLYKLAEAFSNKIGLISITTGENLSQVSTQTQQSLFLLSKTINKLVLRPLLTYEKDEIKQLAKKIETLKFSELIDEICTIEKSSVPFPKEKIFLEEIKKLNFDFERLSEKIKNFNGEKEKELIDIIKKFEKTKRENKIFSFDELKKKENEIENLIKNKKSFIVYCKTSVKSWYYLVKKSRELNVDLKELIKFAFACSEKDLKVNFIDLLSEI